MRRQLRLPRPRPNPPLFPTCCTNVCPPPLDQSADLGLQEVADRSLPVPRCSSGKWAAGSSSSSTTSTNDTYPPRPPLSSTAATHPSTALPQMPPLRVTPTTKNVPPTTSPNPSPLSLPQPPPPLSQNPSCPPPLPTVASSAGCASSTSPSQPAAISPAPL